MSTHTTILNHSFDGENDVTLVITYTYHPGHNGIGPTYDCGGEPPEAPEVEVILVLVDDRTATADEFDMVVCSDLLWQKLCDDAEADRQMAKSDR
tara:strand:- start:1205 stop:1489 length:285 start_codon:yes stop_codon:yes gene_type:complete